MTTPEDAVRARRRLTNKLIAAHEAVRLKPFFAEGRFVGVDLDVHAHVLDDRGVVFVLFNRGSDAKTVDLRFASRLLCLPEGVAPRGEGVVADGESWRVIADLAGLSARVIEIGWA